jgi:transcriptional regulator with XRE-family HTH domain
MRATSCSLTMRRCLQVATQFALVDWFRDDLAKKSDASPNTVWGFEQGRSDPKLSTLNKWQRALEAAGVAFIEPADGKGAGVRMKRDERGKR